MSATLKFIVAALISFLFLAMLPVGASGPFKTYLHYKLSEKKYTSKSYFFEKEPEAGHEPAARLVEVVTLNNDNEQTLLEKKYYNKEGRLIEYTHNDLRNEKVVWMKVGQGSKMAFKITEKGEKDYNDTFDINGKLLLPELEEALKQRIEKNELGNFKFDLFFPASARYGSTLSSFEIKAEVKDKGGKIHFKLTPASIFIRSILPEEKETILLDYEKARKDFVFLSFDGYQYISP